MTIIVNGEEREIRVVDIETGQDYAADIILNAEELKRNEYGDYLMSKEQFAYWERYCAEVEAENERLA